MLVTTGVILFMVSRPDTASRRASDKATVTVAPTTNGVVVLGRF